MVIIYRGILILEKSSVKINAVIYRGIFIPLAPDFHLKIFPVSSDAFKTEENFLAENKFETCRFLFNFSMTLRQGDQIG